MGPNMVGRGLLRLAGALYGGMGVIWYGTFQPYICATELACEYSRLSPLSPMGTFHVSPPPPGKSLRVRSEDIWLYSQATNERIN